MSCLCRTSQDPFLTSCAGIPYIHFTAATLRKGKVIGNWATTPNEDNFKRLSRGFTNFSWKARKSSTKRPCEPNSMTNRKRSGKFGSSAKLGRVAATAVRTKASESPRSATAVEWRATANTACISWDTRNKPFLEFNAAWMMLQPSGSSV